MGQRLMGRKLSTPEEGKEEMGRGRSQPEVVFRKA